MVGISYTMNKMTNIKAKSIAILRWSEKYTGTDMVYLAHGGFWLLVAQGVNFLLSFLLIWAFANLVSKEVYGQYRFFTTTASLLALAALPGMKTAIVRAVAQGRSGVIPSAVRTRIKWGVLGTSAGFIAALYYLYMGDRTMFGLFILVAILVPFTESFEVTQSYHNGRKDYVHYATSSIARYTIIVTTTLIALLLSQNIFVILGAYLISTAAANASIYWHSIHRFPLSNNSDRETIPYGIKLSWVTFLGSAANNIDKVALWYIAGPVQVAVYTIAIAIPKEIGDGLNYIGKLALPKMADRDTRELQYALLRKLLIFFVSTIPIALGYVIVAPFVFLYLLPQYTNAIGYSQLAAVMIVCAPLILLTQYFQATMHVKALSILGMTQPIITIVLFLILIPAFGILGAIYALIGRQLASFIVLLIFFLLDRRHG